MANDLSSMGMILRPGVRTRLINNKRRGREGGPGSGPHKDDNLSQEQHRVLVYKHASGEFPGQKYSTIKSLLKSGHLEHDGKNLKVSAKGKDYVDRNHMKIFSKESLRESVAIKFMDEKAHPQKIRESYRRNFMEQSSADSKQPGPGKGRVYLVTIIEEGLGNSKDKNYYSAEAMQSGIKAFEGAKCFVDHPDAISEKALPERSMKQLAGWYSDCFTDDNPDTGKKRLRGKLHFFPALKWLTDMIDVILSDPTAKGLFGLSINAVGKTRPGEMNGEEVNYVEEFQKVDSADVVTEPAARGKFDKMLESRRSVTGARHPKVSNKSSRRAREAAILSPEQTKAVADSLVSAYNSDSPDEMKQTVFEAAKVLNGSSGVTLGGDDPGKGEQQNSGGKEMPASNKKIKASVGKRTIRRGKTLRAAAQGRESEEAEEDEQLRASEESEESEESNDEVEESDDEMEEADVDHEVSDSDLGDLDDIGGGTRVKASRGKEARRRESPLTRAQRESEEADDEIVEAETRPRRNKERGDTRVSGVEGGLPGADMAAPVGGGAPGSSRTVASEAEEDDSDFPIDDDQDEGDDEMNAEESGTRRPARRKEREGTYGTSGAGMLPGTVFDKGDLVGYDGDETDDDEAATTGGGSNGGVGLSYKLKTSRFARNQATKKVVAPVVREANRRIDHLANKYTRLRESLRMKEAKVQRLSNILSYTESKRRGFALLKEAVKQELLPESVAASMAPRLFGLSMREQKQEIISTSRLLESATEGAVSRMTESVEGNGARGGAAFRYGTAEAENSELISELADAGVPMKEDNE